MDDNFLVVNLVIFVSVNESKMKWRLKKMRVLGTFQIMVNGQIKCVLLCLIEGKKNIDFSDAKHCQKILTIYISGVYLSDVIHI